MPFFELVKTIIKGKSYFQGSFHPTRSINKDYNTKYYTLIVNCLGNISKTVKQNIKFLESTKLKSSQRSSKDR